MINANAHNIAFQKILIRVISVSKQKRDQIVSYQTGSEVLNNKIHLIFPETIDTLKRNEVSLCGKNILDKVMNMPSPYTLHILHEGYSRGDATGMDANCTCSLITGPTNIIVDTMTPWDKDIITKGLKEHNVDFDDVKLVVSTHGHSDHVGNNNLFLKAKHVVGFSVSFEHKYFDHSFLYGEELVIDDYVKVIATPGHTLTDVSVLLQTDNLGLVAITGDLFEKEEDLMDESIWMVTACSEAPKLQEINRNKIIQMVDYIVPGHGPIFKVTKEMKAKVKNIHNEQHYI